MPIKNRSLVYYLYVLLLFSGSAPSCFGQAQANPPEKQVEMKELKTSIAVDVLASPSKVFKTKQKIIRVAVSDPSVAEVVLMNENQFVVISKKPGAINVAIWCEKTAAGGKAIYGLYC